MRREEEVRSASGVANIGLARHSTAQLRLELGLGLVVNVTGIGWIRRSGYDFFLIFYAWWLHSVRSG